ncbi:hypothetical protein FDECE_13564 [Fusarium decemcellulare]|nr:hypothetical protein FDECE_13564 [Fusarium decemcellulare]
MNCRQDRTNLGWNEAGMCTLIYRKYDCTKCQRRVRDDKWIEECERVREGRRGTCKPKMEYETGYVSADECEVCEMYRVMEEEAAVEADVAAEDQEKKDKEACRAI